MRIILREVPVYLRGATAAWRVSPVLRAACALILGLWVATIAGAGAVRAQTSGSLTTIYGWGNSNAGVAFDMVAKDDNLQITRIAVNLQTTGTKTIAVYRKADGVSSGASWVEIFNGAVVSAGSGNPTPIDTTDFDLPAGGRAALYVLVLSPDINAPGENGRIHIRDGTGVGDPWYENDELSILQGYGSSQCFGCLYATRNFQGTIYYDIAPADTEPPVISGMPDNIVSPTDAGAATAVVSWTPPTASDDVAVTSFTSSHAPGDTFPLGTTAVSYTARDDAGNETVASFTVTVTDGEKPVISGLPVDILLPADPGESTAAVGWTAPTASDNVAVASFTSSHAPGDTFPLGTTTVSYTARDDAGNETVASFTVTVTDDEPPVFTAFPGDIEVEIDYPETSTVVSWTPPAVSDNAAGASVTRTEGPAPGSAFPVGVTSVTYRATDAAGNSVSRSFTVTVSVIPPASVTFAVETGADGTFTFTSPEPELNVSVTTDGGRGTSVPIRIRPGAYQVTFAIPAGFAVFGASCTGAGSTLHPAARTGALVLASGEAVTCTIVTRDSVGETTGLIGAFMESRARLILQNAPDPARRLERLQGRYSNTGGISGFGLGYRDPSLPFALSVSPDETRFASSLRRMHAPGGPARLEGNPLVALAALMEHAGTSDRRDTGAMTGAGATRRGSAPAAAPDMPGGQDGAALAYARGEASGSRGGMGVADSAQEVDPMAYRFDIWLEGRAARYTASGADGRFAIVHAGADYLLSPDVLVGLGLQADWADHAAQGGGAASGSGFLVGPYMTARLAESFYVDARLAWGRSRNRVSPFGLYEDTFDAERWLATAALINQFAIGRFRIQPETRLSYFRETSEAYTDSLGVAIPAVAVETGTLEFGPTISTQMELAEGVAVEPFTTVEGIWTFRQENTATAFSNQPGLADRGLRGRAEIGVRLTGEHAWLFSASAYFDGIGDPEFSAWGMKSSLDRQF